MSKRSLSLPVAVALLAGLSPGDAGRLARLRALHSP
jgi:hypothetical protein